MKDYWRLIGITSENAASDQIRQAHFRAFRFYQGQKNNSRTAEQRAEAERVIDFLRLAQHNPDLPLPDQLKHLLPPLPLPQKTEAPAPKAEEMFPPVAPTKPIELPKPAPQTKPIEQPAPVKPAKPIDVEVFEDPDIKRMAQNIFGVSSDAHAVKEPALEESIPPTHRLGPPPRSGVGNPQSAMESPEQSIPDTDNLIPDTDELVEEGMSLEPVLDDEAPSSEAATVSDAVEKRSETGVETPPVETPP